MKGINSRVNLTWWCNTEKRRTGKCVAVNVWYNILYIHPAEKHIKHHCNQTKMASPVFLTIQKWSYNILKLNAWTWTFWLIKGSMQYKEYKYRFCINYSITYYIWECKNRQAISSENWVNADQRLEREKLNKCTLAILTDWLNLFRCIWTLICQLTFQSKLQL